MSGCGGGVNRTASLRVTCLKELLHCSLHLLKGTGAEGGEGLRRRRGESAHRPALYPVTGKPMFAVRRSGDQQQYFIVTRYCPFSWGAAREGEGSVCLIFEGKSKLELFSRNSEKSTQFAWERALTVWKCIPCYKRVVCVCV